MVLGPSAFRPIALPSLLTWGERVAFGLCFLGVPGFCLGAASGRLWLLEEGGRKRELGAFLPYLPLPWEVFCFVLFFFSFPPMAASPLQFQLLPYDPGSWAMVIPLPPSVFLDLGTIVAFCYGQSGWSCHPLLASDLHPTYNQFPELPFIWNGVVHFPGWCLTDTNLLEVSCGTLKPLKHACCVELSDAQRDFGLPWEEFFSCWFERDKSPLCEDCIHWKCFTHQTSPLLVCMVPASQGGAYPWEVIR